MIASENFVPHGDARVPGSVLTNKYAEGLPGKRYYGGCEYVDMAETAGHRPGQGAVRRRHANVQPHSGAPANAAAYFALLEPGDTILAWTSPTAAT